MSKKMLVYVILMLLWFFIPFIIRGIGIDLSDYIFLWIIFAIISDISFSIFELSRIIRFIFNNYPDIYEHCNRIKFIFGKRKNKNKYIDEVLQDNNNFILKNELMNFRILFRCIKLSFIVIWVFAVVYVLSSN